MMQYGSDSPLLSATIMSCLDGREDGERVSRRVGERLSGCAGERLSRWAGISATWAGPGATTTYVTAASPRHPRGKGLTLSGRDSPEQAGGLLERWAHGPQQPWTFGPRCGTPPRW